MMNEELEQQASLYALGLLEGEENSAFGAQLAANEELRAFVDAMQETAAHLAYGTPLRQPPAHLESRIRAAIHTEPTTITHRSTSLNWLPWALAAGLAVASVFLLADRAATKKELAELRSRNAFAQLRIATLSSKLSSAPSATGVVVWDAEKQEGVLKVANVPATEQDQDYQLWIVDPDYKQPVDAGVFAVDAKGAKKILFKPKAKITAASAFAVSLERKGGAPKAEGPMVLLGK